MMFFSLLIIENFIWYCKSEFMKLQISFGDSRMRITVLICDINIGLCLSSSWSFYLTYFVSLKWSSSVIEWMPTVFCESNQALYTNLIISEDSNPILAHKLPISLVYRHLNHWSATKADQYSSLKIRPSLKSNTCIYICDILLRFTWCTGM